MPVKLSKNHKFVKLIENYMVDILIQSHFFPIFITDGFFAVKENMFDCIYTENTILSFH